MGELRLKDKKFVRYEKGAELYDMCQKSFEKLARNANATYKVGTALVSVLSERLSSLM